MGLFDNVSFGNGPFGGVNISNLFVSALQQQASLDALSNQALSRGIDLYTRKDYAAAAREFQRAVNINPASEYATAATQHLAQSYLKLDRTADAINAYQTALRRNPLDADLQLALGNILFSEDRFAEAVQSYRQAVQLSPADSTAHYSLGEGLLRLDRPDEAAQSFRAVIRLEPHSPHGYLGLGKAFAAQGEQNAAIAQFDAALAKQADYYEAMAEKGYAYAALGQIENAREQAALLDGRDKTLHALLTAHIDRVEPPKMVMALSAGTFRYSSTWKTPLSQLDDYFQTANAAKTLTMKIVFSKPMDRSSVENIANWSITRAKDANLAKTYNFGQAVPESEVVLNLLPNFVLYDAASQTATIGFTLTQNDTASATIDPSHIVFQFKGRDAQGVKMDPKGDEFSGFSKVT